MSFIKPILFIAVLAFLSFKNQAQTVTDIDGNVYNTLTIGTQKWLKEDLKVVHYNNGDPISYNASGISWGNLTSGIYGNYLDDSNNVAIYGRLYNWYAVNNIKNICPVGWHVPGDWEWNILEKYLDNTVDTTITGQAGTDIGAKIKEEGSVHWNSPNCANNISGFTALPGGYRGTLGADWGIGEYSSWWSSTGFNELAWYRYLFFNECRIIRNQYGKFAGFSVRCIMNTTTSTINNNHNNFENIRLYPNPATDKIYIEYNEAQYIKIQVYNIIGDCVINRELNNRENDINIGYLSKGFYIIKINGDDRTVQSKFIKE